MPSSSVNRRRFLRLAASGGSAAALGWVGHAQEPAPPAASDTGAEFVTPETRAAIDRGLAFLARTQLADGSFPDRFVGSAVGTTAIAGLALMSAGHQPGRGPLGTCVSRALDFVLAAAAGPSPGFLTAAESQHEPGNQRAMYSHGFASLFLAEVCGMLPDPDRHKRVRGVLEQATAFTVGAQSPADGGWRYVVRPPYSDVSVTVAQMMALRAARNAGVLVRKSVVDKAAAFVRDCQQPDGGFSYFKGAGGRGSGSEFARSAAAIVGLYSAGVYDGREIERGLQYVKQFLPGRPFSERGIPLQNYYYGQYYAALAMWTAGGDAWAQWFPAVRDELLARGRAGGGTWTDPNNPAYATAMALIVLQLPNNYLPILQK